jgi:hypothetical protein
MGARLVCALVCASGIAHAQKFERVATVTAASSTPALRSVGEHHISLTPLVCHADACTTDVVDLSNHAVSRVQTSRAMLERHFGHASGAYQSLDGTLVQFTAARAGFLFTDRDTAGSSHWYGEVDAKTGAFVRAAKLAKWKPETDLYFLGNDFDHEAVWFYLENYDGPRDPAAHYMRAKSASSIVFRRLDLKTFGVADVASVALPGRKQQAPLEDQLFVHHSDDFSQFVVAEYYEEPHRLSPPASAYIVDAHAATSFSVPIPEVVYAAAFAHDNAYLYLSGAVNGDLVRVDLTAHAIDKTVHGPKLTHEAVVTPDGKHLLVLGAAKRYLAFDLPDLAHGKDLAHDQALAPAFAALYGGAALSADGKFFVLGQPGRKRDTADFVITRVVD